MTIGVDDKPVAATQSDPSAIRTAATSDFVIGHVIVQQNNEPDDINDLLEGIAADPSFWQSGPKLYRSVKLLLMAPPR